MVRLRPLIRFQFRKFGSLFVLLIIHLASFSQSLKGKVSDMISDEVLVGANVHVKETGQKLFVELDGYFRINAIKPGNYTLIISYAGYDTKTEPVTISSNKTNNVHFRYFGHQG